MKMSNPPQDAGGSNPLAPTNLKYLRRFSFERGRGGGFSPGAGLREQNRSKPSRNRSDDLGFAANGWIETARQGAEREPIDLRAQVVRNQMPVRLGREAGSEWRRILCTAATSAPRTRRREAVVCRRWWNRIGRTCPEGQSFIWHRGQRRSWSSDAAST